MKNPSESSKNSESRLEEKALQQILISVTDDLPIDQKNTLVAIVQFGSSVRKPIKRETDVDLMLIFENLPSHRWDRYALFSEFEGAVQAKLDAMQSRGLKLQFSPLYKTKSEFLQWSPLYLDWKDAQFTVYDACNIVPLLLKKVDEWKVKNQAYRVNQGLKWYWVYSKNHKEPVELSFPADDVQNI